MMLWHVPRMWEDGKCYIIGGGASILRQFDVPTELAVSIQNNQIPLSHLSPYFAPIHGEHVIAINSAYKLGPWIDVMFFGDSGWYEKNRLDLALFTGIKVTCAIRLIDSFSSVNIKCIERDKKKRHGISKEPGMVSWNAHSGGAAINLAVAFGVKTIYLLGFDMNSDNGKTHWHGEYKKRLPTVAPPRQRGKVPSTKPPYIRHLRAYPDIAQDAKRMGVQIINTNSASAITVFPTEERPWART